MRRNFSSKSNSSRPSSSNNNPNSKPNPIPGSKSSASAFSSSKSKFSSAASASAASNNPFNRFSSAALKTSSRLKSELIPINRPANSFNDSRLISSDDRIQAHVNERIRHSKSRQIPSVDNKISLTHKGVALDSENFIVSDHESSEEERAEQEYNNQNHYNQHRNDNKHTHDGKEKSTEPADDENDFGETRESLNKLSAAELVERAGLSRDSGGSKREIMQEIMAKSKLFKAEKSAEKELQLEKLNEIDSELKDIQSLLEYKTDSTNTDNNNKNNKKSSKELEDNDYFTESKKLLFEPRAAAVDRIKNDEEMARESMEKLNKLEKIRLLRMSGDYNELEEKRILEEEINKSNNNNSYMNENVMVDKETRKRKREENEMKEANKLLNNGGDGDENGNNNGEEELIAEEEENNNDFSIEKFSSFGNGSSASTTNESKKQNTLKSKSKENEKQNNKNINESIPYVFTCPSTYDEFFSILSSHPLESHSIIVDRIIACTHLSLKPENRKKMNKFHSILLEHSKQLGLAYESNYISLEELLEQLNWITRIGYSQAELLGPIVITQLRNKLHKIYNSIILNSEYLSYGIFIQFIIYSQWFPMSDYRHNIVTPLYLLLTELINKRNINSLYNYIEILNFISILLDGIHISKRFIPELYNSMEKCGEFLLNYMKSNRNQLELEFAITLKQKEKIKFSIAEKSTLLLSLQVKTNTNNNNNNNNKDNSININIHEFLQLISVYLYNLNELSTISSKFPSYSILFQPFVSIMNELIQLIDNNEDKDNDNNNSLKNIKNLLSSLITQRHLLTQSIADSISTRRPLTLFHRAIEIPRIISHAPAFVERFNGNNSLDPIKERVKNRQLEKKMKLEKKSAIKSIRLESNEIHQQFRKQSQAREANWNKMTKKTWSELEIQQRDTNILEKMKKKKKKLQ